MAEKRAMIEEFDFWPSHDDSDLINPIIDEHHVWDMLDNAIEGKRHLVNNTKDLLRKHPELE